MTNDSAKTSTNSERRDENTSLITKTVSLKLSCRFQEVRTWNLDAKGYDRQTSLNDQGHENFPNHGGELMRVIDTETARRR